MDEVIQVVELGRQVRTQYDLKVRQPLRSLRVVSRDPARLDRIRALKDVVADELNVREVVFGHQESDLAVLKAKADFKKLGSRLGSAMKVVAEQVRGWSSAQVESVLEGGSVAVEAGGQTIHLTAHDILVDRTPKPGLAVASAGALVVALDTALDADLIREGLAREFVNKVQSLRKAADLNIAQRITLTYHAGAEIREAIDAHRAYIEAETLSVQCRSSEDVTEGESVDLNGHPCRIQLIPKPLAGND
jgi:isoleucyl-tRNA synthetase